MRTERSALVGSLFAATFAALVGAAAVGTGCASLSIAANADGGAVPLIESDADTTSEDGAATSADASSTKSPYNGSPLCHASASTCFPDVASATASDAGDAGQGLGPVSMRCSSTGDTGDAGDAGIAAADSAYPSVACRVRAASAVQALPTCASAGGGMDGASCKTGAECAPGFDCVGSGVCRQYCCAGECGGKINSTSNFFCDIVSLTEETTLVPACVPVQGCSLLDPTACPDKETCSIVKDDGTTSCVAVGPAGQGESCDQTHCAAGLACLGQPGVRQCFQLCKAQQSTCPNGMACKANALSHDPSVGICQ